MITSNCKEQPKIKEELKAGRASSTKKRQEVGSGNSSTDSVNSWSGPDYQICYCGLSQNVFRLNRVKSSSCDCPENIPVDMCSNASCSTCFSSGSSSPEVAEFCPSFFTLGLFHGLGLSFHLCIIQRL
jgi:hypothetical protein